MKPWERFKSLKQRGEWVELQFMAEAARRRYMVCKPWGDSRPYDVGIEHGLNYLRVQVKSSTCRLGRGYYCQFKPDWSKKNGTYSLERLDLFAAYVIPVNVWYLIPASVLLGRNPRKSLMLFPVEPPKKRGGYECECYKEAWDLLSKSRRVLSGHRR
jgi:hypothetical protein